MPLCLQLSTLKSAKCASKTSRSSLTHVSSSKVIHSLLFSINTNLSVWLKSLQKQESSSVTMVCQLMRLLDLLGGWTPFDDYLYKKPISIKELTVVGKVRYCLLTPSTNQCINWYSKCGKGERRTYYISDSGSLFHYGSDGEA